MLDKNNTDMQPVTIHESLVSLSSRARVDTSPVVEFTVNLFSATPSAISYVSAVFIATNKARKINRPAVACNVSSAAFNKVQSFNCRLIL